MTDLNPYRAIIGDFPSKQDYAEWSSDKWLDFIRYVEFHLASKVNPRKRNETVERFVVTNVLMKEIESFLNVPNHPWLEFIWRANMFISEGTTTGKYQMRIQVFCRNSLTWLKYNPTRISEEMEKVLVTHERMRWCIKQYYLKETDRGPIVQRDTLIPDGNKANLPSVQQKMADSLIKVVDLYQDLVASIKKSHLDKGLTVKDKLNALPKLVDAIVKMSSRKTAANHFTQINIHGNARDMEQTMLDYVKTKEDQE